MRKELGAFEELYQEALNHIIEGEGVLPNATTMGTATNMVYGLAHARFLTTARGANLLLEKYESGTYGKCARFKCGQQNLLPLGLSDAIKFEPVKLFCPSCQELYNCDVSLAGGYFLEGAYFGTSATPMMLLAHPRILQAAAITDNVEYPLKIFGFKIHPSSQLALNYSANGTIEKQDHQNEDLELESPAAGKKRERIAE